MVIEIQSQVEPPGYYIERELDARGWSQTDLAYILDMSAQQLNPILKGKHAITADKAILFAEAFGMPAEFFTNLENQYQLSKAKAAPPAVKARAIWQGTFPVREMIKRGWIEETDPSLLETQMLRFFETFKLADMPFVGDGHQVAGYAAKKTNPYMPNPEELAWVYRVRQIAKTQHAPAYSKEKLWRAIEALKSMRNSLEDIASVPSALNKCGVRFVVVETLPKAKIDGVCTWIDNQQPVVAITNRYDRLDNFWFVLRHELEHVLQEHGQQTGYTAVDNLDGENSNTDETVTEEERIANTAAAEFCIPQKQLQSFIARKSPYISEKDVIGFARRLEVHPALAVGQLQKETGKWNFLRKYLSSSVSGIRNILLSELHDQNIIDGWGLKANTQL